MPAQKLPSGHHPHRRRLLLSDRVRRLVHRRAVLYHRLRLLALLLLEAVFPFHRLAVQPVTPGLNLRAVTPKDRA
jgi:hypothetical protein